MELNNRFSIAHYDCWSDSDLYYNVFKNSSPGFKNEIFDIYFGKSFRHNYREQEIYDKHRKTHEVVYGNVMGVEASEEQIDNLFNIQKEFGVEISLTINQLNIPVEIFYSKNNRVIKSFLNWLGDFYDRGLRSCTLANNHLMRTGYLQKQFPEMKWKNTVNQQVSSAQHVLDYLYLGYNIIQLDRSLNRNVEELKKIKGAVEWYRKEYPGRYVKTCLLVWEDCIPSCPFKREHDDLQIYHQKIIYWESDLGIQTCKRWRNKKEISTLPRSGNNCYWSNIDTFKEYMELVDIFKYSGRLMHIVPDGDLQNIQFCWLAGNNAVRSFHEIIENQLEPLLLWQIGVGLFSHLETNINTIKRELKESVWLTDEGKKLEEKLKNCRNQCYQCHLCETVAGIPGINSMIEI